MSLEEQFEDAAKRVTELTEKPGNDVLLDLYSLYKQGKDGDVTGTRPGMMDFAGRAKFDAWTKRKGMTKEQSMQEYINIVNKLASGG